jgi:hypothetical protein
MAFGFSPESRSPSSEYSMWQQTPFGKLQALPKDARPVSLLADRDVALVNVADGIRQVAEKLLSSR